MCATKLIIAAETNKNMPIVDSWDNPSDYHFMDVVYIHQVNFSDRIARYTTLHPSFGFYTESVARFTIKPKY
jgi:hypothetical protein